MRHPEISGSAVWADPNVIGKKFAYNEKRDFWIGRNPYEYGQALGYDDDRHVFLCAGTGSGKGRSIVVNNLLNWRGSIVSVDPKGDNASICATRRAHGDEYCDGLKQPTFVLDPYNVVKDIPDELRASCNLLDLLDPQSPSLLEDAKFLAEAMRMTEPGAESESWSKDSASITGLVIAHVISHPMFNPSERNLVTVRQLLQKGDKKYVENAKAKNQAERISAEREEREPRLIKVPSPHEALFMLMNYNDAQDRALADEAEAYIDLMKTNPKQWGSLIKGARDETAFIDSLNMKRQLRPDPEDRRIFSLKDLVYDKKGISIFISLPDDPELSAIRWQKALLLLIHRYMRREQQDPATGLKVLMCLDEFASMGKMPEFPRSMTAVRSSGIKMFVIVTNVTGMKELYQGAFGDIMQGCTLQIFMDCADPETRAYIEEHFGEAQVLMTTRGGSVSVNQSEGVQTTDGFSQGVSVQHSRGTSDATSYSKSLARSDSHSFSNAISDVESWNDAEGESSSDTIGSQSSWQLSSAISKNSNWQDSKNKSRSSNRSYNTSSAFGVSHNNYAWFKPFLKSTNDTRQNGRSHGSQNTTGESSSVGGSEGETNTQSTGGGQNKAHTLGRQITKSKGGSKGQTQTQGRTQGQTDTETYGVSHTLSETYSQGWTENYSRSQGKSFQEGITLSANWQENILKRPLITRDEANLFLARVDEREHPAYPGMMLVQISGQSPFLARRCHYDEDPEFEGKYRPLPKYRDKYLPYSKQRLVGGAYTEDHFLPIRLPPPIAKAKEAIEVTITADTDEWFSAGDQIFN
jgi:type IV secretory pathway TraG/TraD family ATPase VirD4